MLPRSALPPRAATAGSRFQAQTEAGLQIFTVRANGHDLQRITHVDGDAAGPDWSPDGRRIAFSLNECSVAVMDADGDNLDVIASDPDLCQGDPSYTPDGARLVFVRFDPVREVEEIWSMKTDGSDQHFVTGLAGADPTCLRMDGKISFKGSPDGALFVANIDGAACRADFAFDLGHLQARLGARRRASGRQRQLRSCAG